MSETIICPSCKCQIEVAEALVSQLREQLQQEFQAHLQQRESSFADREAALKQQQLAVDAARKAVEAEITSRLEQARVALAEEAKAQAEEAAAMELAAAHEDLTNTRAKLLEAQQNELRVRQERSKLEEEKNALELEVVRRLDDEKSKVRVQAKEEADEEHRLSIAEKEMLIGQMKKQIDELKRKAEQGSQQLQGEVLELDLEGLLCERFPLDKVEPVPKGVHGGDLTQTVLDRSGGDCGVILWESKRTKHWSDGWLQKLKDDQRAAKAHMAVLVSDQLPKSITTFGLVEGVWITSRACALSLGSALREGMLQVAAAHRAATGQQLKSELVYAYLSSQQFVNRVGGIVDAFSAMKEDLEKERRSISRQWAKREKELERAMASTVCMYGDLQGIIGGALPEMKLLALPGTVEEVEAKEQELAESGSGT